MNSYDSIVIGGGISGLLSALVLSKSGKKVLLFERNKRLGNNCNSYSVDGYRVDTGPHAITQFNGGPLSYLIDNYFNYAPVFVDYGNYYIRDENGLKEVPTTLKGYLTMDLLPGKDRLTLVQSLTKMLLLWQVGTDLSNISVCDCLPWDTLSPDTIEFMDTFSYFLSGRSAKETSVQRLFIGSGIIGEDFEKTASYEGNERQHAYSKLKKMSNVTKLLNNNKVNFNQLYPRDGLKAILNAILYSLPETVEIKTSTPIEKIILEDNAAKGVLTKEGSYFADIIVYSAFAKDLPRYIADLLASYVSDLNRIKQAKSLTIWLGLDERFEEFNYIGGEVWFKKKPFWAMPISNYNKNFAPRGKKLVGFMFSIDENNSLESEKLDAYNTILRVYPGINNHIDMIHYQVTIPEKAAVAINGFIAETITPIKNLYLVGTDADDRSMGITRAAYSVVKLIKVLKTERILDA